MHIYPKSTPTETVFYPTDKLGSVFSAARRFDFPCETESKFSHVQSICALHAAAPFFSEGVISYCNLIG